MAAGAIAAGSLTTLCAQHVVESKEYQFKMAFPWEYQTLKEGEATVFESTNPGHFPGAFTRISLIVFSSPPMTHEQLMPKAQSAIQGLADGGTMTLHGQPMIAESRYGEGIVFAQRFKMSQAQPVYVYGNLHNKNGFAYMIIVMSTSMEDGSELMMDILKNRFSTTIDTIKELPVRRAIPVHPPLPIKSEEAKSI